MASFRPSIWAGEPILRISRYPDKLGQSYTLVANPMEIARTECRQVCLQQTIVRSYPFLPLSIYMPCSLCYAAVQAHGEVMVTVESKRVLGETDRAINCSHEINKLTLGEGQIGMYIRGL